MDLGKIKTASVIAFSALPSDKRIRQARIEYHVRQRAEFREKKHLWGNNILSFCSGWTQKELEERFEPYSYISLKERTPKYIKHNMALDVIYNRPGNELKNYLFLDDDVVPREWKVSDPENGIVRTHQLCANWIHWPEQMPGHVCFFAAQGLMFDAYYKSNPVILGPATPQVVGWAMMVRSDCGVLWDGKIMKFVTDRRYTSDDTAFRLHCEDQGKIVLKHNRAFFKTFQPKVDTTSTYANGQEDRRPIIKADMALLRSMYPNIFNPKKKGKQVTESEGGGLFNSKH